MNTETTKNLSGTSRKLITKGPRRAWPMGCRLATGRSWPVVSPVITSGDARPRADTEPGRAVDAAARRKLRQTYPEFERPWRCRLVVVGAEVGGRFGAEAADFLCLLARHRAESTPVMLRPAAQAAWLLRWSGLLAVAAQRLRQLPPSAPAWKGVVRGRACARVV